MVTWCIKEYMQDCPQGWQKLIKDMETRLPFDNRDGFSVETINHELSKYQATYYDNGRNGFVEFKNNKYYSLFVLKYGGRQ